MPPRPDEALRRGFDPAHAVEITTKGGVTLWAEPLRFTAADLLSGDPAAHLACSVRDRWVGASLGRGELPVSDIPRLAVLALARTYPLASAAERDSWLSPDDPDTLVRLASVACGMESRPVRARVSALAVAACGMADCEMTAQEIAQWADWAANNRNTPAAG